MTSEAQRIAIAQACGWTGVHWYEDNAGPPILSGIPPTSFKETGRKEKTYGGTVPDYLNDLNAMHEAEKVLPTLQRGLYRDILVDFAGNSYACFATATQRAEAFLRTLNLWRDDP